MAHVRRYPPAPIGSKAASVAPLMADSRDEVSASGYVVLDALTLEILAWEPGPPSPPPEGNGDGPAQ